MDKNEFYKELMSEYMFDHEKIKAAAMGKATPIKKRSGFYKTAISIGTATAAAIAAVTIGTTLLVNSGNPVDVTPANSITPSDRFRMAVEAYENAESSDEEIFLYVTFTNAETADDMQSILSKTDSTGKIKVVSVYTSYNTVISGSDNIQQLFYDNEETIKAVKIRCPQSFIRSLSKTPEVWLVETEDAFKDSEFSVIDTNGSYDDHPNFDENSVVIGDTTIVNG